MNSNVKINDKLDDFNELENKTQLQLNKLILKYENIIDKVKKRKEDKICCDFKNQILDDFRYGVRCDDVRKQYLMIIRINLIKARELYEKMKVELVTLNKKKELDHLKEKRLCQCGCVVSLVHMSRHKTTSKHQKHLIDFNSFKQKLEKLNEEYNSKVEAWLNKKEWNKSIAATLKEIRKKRIKVHKDRKRLRVKVKVLG
jgi:hypothetical protein